MKTSLLVYLAGPMTGQTYEETVAWRDWVREHLEESSFTVLDPARGVMFLEPDDVVKDAYTEHLTESKHIVFTRDKFDSTRADILLVNLLDAKRISIGTLMEMAWAHLAGRFTVTIMEPNGNPHEHAFVREASSIVLPDIEEAVDYIVRTFEV